MSKLRQLNILFGSACNRSCEYCLQTGSKSLADRKADPDKFCDNLVKKLVCPPNKISFWGGEPTVYWSTIKRVHSGLKVRGFLPSTTVITTNGRELTQDFVDYCNDEGIFVVVSCHGGDFSTEQLQMIGQLKYLSMTELITHDRISTDGIRDFYYKVKAVIGKRPAFCLFPVISTDGCHPKFYLTYEDVDEFIAHLKHDVVPRVHSDEYCNRLCRQLLWTRDNLAHTPNGLHCYRDDTLSIDLHGNVYQCHHNYDVSNVLGNMFTVIPIYKEPLKDPRRNIKQNPCMICSAYKYCRSGCYTSNTPDVDCYLSRRMSEVYTLIEEAL